MDISDLQEQLAGLYLRLNGYFVSGFIIHAPEDEVNKKGEPRKVRGEVDVLAVRFPHNAEPEREVDPSDYLHISDTHIDILICEVKGGNQPLQFNEGLRTNPDAVLSVLRWIGILDEDYTRKIVEEVKQILSTQYANSPDKFREHNIPDSNYRIRAMFFAPDREAPVEPNQQRYIYGDEILNYIWRCLRPTETRPLSQTRYDYGLWGTYERIIRYFKYKNGENHGTMQDLYAHEKAAEFIEQVCKRENINAKELRMGAKRGRIGRVRSQIACQLVEDYGIPLAEVGRQLGVTTSAISKAINRITKT